MKLWGLYLLLLAVSALGQTYTQRTLYSFGTSATDGNGPYSGLVMDSKGNLYGTTSSGGTVKKTCPSGCGTVFKLNTSGVETILHRFAETDGAVPGASLSIDKSGNLYGMTQFGGSTSSGVVFKITAAGKFSVLHHFGEVAGDGQYPIGPLTLDSAGNMYGTTTQGGLATNACVDPYTGCGIVFKLTPKGTETILYKFTGVGGDGASPSWNLLRDGNGNLFGVAYGSLSFGVLFEVSATGKESILYSGNLQSYLARNAAGTFFGTFQGTVSQGGEGVWEISGTPLTENDAYFCQGCVGDSTDGWDLWSPLVFYNGIMYGTAVHGGASDGGVVYSFNPANGFETVLYNFPSPSSTVEIGWYPYGGVIADTKGNLYGTTVVGGKHGGGTVFELVKN